jgi:hypothetical protein
MPVRNVITMCHFNRPAYSRQVIEALRGCDGIGDYLILPHVEPGNDEVRALVVEIDFAECIPTFNAERFGVDLNTELALADGFQHSDFVIHIEDDVVCARDALRYFEWCRERFRDDISVFSVTGYNRCAELPPPDRWHRVSVRHWFHPLACGIWKDRWESFRGRLHSAPAGWDDFLNWMFCAGEQPGAFVEVYPELSRAQHIGVESSVHSYSPDWYREHHHVPHWAGDYDVPAGVFHFGPSL